MTDLIQAWRDLATKANAIIPHQIVGEPDKTDAYNLADDMEALWRIVDPLIKAYGDYAKSTLGLSDDEVAKHFTDQLRGALEGNATYALTSAGDQIEELRDDTRADHEIALRRERAA